MYIQEVKTPPENVTVLLIVLGYKESRCLTITNTPHPESNPQPSPQKPVDAGPEVQNHLHVNRYF